MEEEGKGAATLKQNIKEEIDRCADVSLLDFVYKLLTS